MIVINGVIVDQPNASWSDTNLENLHLQLANTEEYIEGQSTGSLGEVLVRCNNVLYIRGADEEEGAMGE